MSRRSRVRTQLQIRQVIRRVNCRTASRGADHHRPDKGHAKELRDGANAMDDYGARATEEEAQRWERLAAEAEAELRALRPVIPHPDVLVRPRWLEPCSPG
jgi:hypothetical protein